MIHKTQDELAPALFVVGAPRSGTTLLRFMLDAHPDLAIPPETGFVPVALGLAGEGAALREAFLNLLVSFPPSMSGWNDFKLNAADFSRALAAIEPFNLADGLRCFYRLYAARFNKARWGDKTPGYSCSILKIAAVFPEARFVHLIRDGRDMALSLRKMWFAPGTDMTSLATSWASSVREGRSQGMRVAHYLEVRYEDLIQQPERELRRICEFGGLSYAAEMLEYHQRVPQRLEEHEGRMRSDGTVFLSKEARLAQQVMTRMPVQTCRIQSWRNEMTFVERSEFESVAGDLLEELGYL